MSGMNAYLGGFMSFLTVFQSAQDNGRVVMKGSLGEVLFRYGCYIIGII